MTDEIRRRAACDRCHAHKLKCSLDNPGQAACNRCSKAQKECVFSPFRQKKTLEHANHKNSAITNSLAASSNEQDDSSSQDINNHTRKRQRLISQRGEPLSQMTPLRYHFQCSS
ncbi:hypothetical protein HYFRA_00004318 [Hymenoscyphus fraxineus]|uniref:Zn(2)-C6 fungal-type domain-containing protein n=1 Tax=Hymenoscyphus fraxineus TaxID=746836 RepID=A0A9N9PKK0_9HELO|nr:hypothetical protein HYFRA_00004318 [Hymenoscyphus fraxineus]